MNTAREITPVTRACVQRKLRKEPYTCITFRTQKSKRRRGKHVARRPQWGPDCVASCG